MGIIVPSYRTFGSRYSKSSIDPDNPPPHVREAAAEFGMSVHEYKKRYLDEPSACEVMNLYYKKRVDRPNKEDPSICNFYLKVKEHYQCEKFEKLYQHAH